MLGALLCTALAWNALPAPRAHAQEHGVLLRLLRDGESFRVRTRAALALGRSGDPSVSRALVRALDDQHAAVRAAAATALGQVGDAAAIASLQRAKRDPAPDVAKQAAAAMRALGARTGGDAEAKPRATPVDAEGSLRRARYAVVLGDMRNDSPLKERELTSLLARRIAHELRSIGRVAVFTQEELTDKLVQAIGRRRIPTFRIEGSLRRVEPTMDGDSRAVRAEVSLLLLDEPGRNMRSMLRGAATGAEQRRGARAKQIQELARKALRNAVRSAMSNAQEAIRAAAAVHAPRPKDKLRVGPAAASLTRQHRGRARRD